MCGTPASLLVNWIWNGVFAGTASWVVSYAMFWAAISSTSPAPPPDAEADAEADADSDGAVDADAEAEALAPAEPLAETLGSGVADGAGAYVQPGLAEVQARRAARSAATTDRGRSGSHRFGGPHQMGADDRDRGVAQDATASAWVGCRPVPVD